MGWAQSDDNEVGGVAEPASHPVKKVSIAKHSMVHHEVEAGTGSTRACQAEGSRTTPEVVLVASVHTLAADMPTFGRKVARLVCPAVPWVDVQRPQ